MHKKTMDVVAAVIWQGEGSEKKYLAQQRPLHYPMGGLWEFPGGKVDKGESLEDALKRELFEELHIVITEFYFWKTILHTYPHRHVRLHLFHVQGFEGEVTCVEGQNIRWVYTHEAQELNFLEADIALVAELTKNYS